MDNNKLLENATREVFEWAKKYGELKAQYDALEQGSIRKNQALQDRNDELEQWKREATLVLNPILDYGQKHPDIKLGQSISTFVVDRCKQYEELKAENERWVKMYKAQVESFADFQTKYAALKEKADKMADVVEGIMSDNHRNEDGSWETPIVISEHLMPYLEQAYSNKEVDNG